MPHPNSERGAALLTVLLIVAVVAVMAGAALEKLRLSTRLAGNAAAIEQARAYAYAAETLATVKVDDLLGRDATRVTLAGDWSNKPFGLPLPGGGFATARVRDGGNCFNLNGLVTSPAPGIYVKSELLRLQFVRLMTLIDIPQQIAEQIAASASDWIDSDQDVQPSGAEDGSYTGRETPYRTAGTLMADPSELRAVAGMTPEIYAQLRPWICTLPKAIPSAINVNTVMPEQAPLLAMLLPGVLTVPAARAALLKRPPQGFAKAADFWAAAGVGAGAAPVGVTTTWFTLDVDVALGSTDIQERATIDATRLPAQIVSRQWGERP